MSDYPAGRKTFSYVQSSRFGVPVAMFASVAWGAISGWWTPRGPATTAQALASIGISLGVGLLAGWLSRSRWAMLLAPALFAVTVEVIRAGLQGPTVDAPHLSPFGILALLVGRGFHGLLSLLPLLVGAAYGAGIARRAEPTRVNGRRVWRYLGRTVLGVLAGAVLLVAVGVALPARTPAILGADGKPRPGSVAELTSVTVAGHRLGLMIRGAAASAPVLLFIPGPPGGSEIGGLRRHLAGLEQYFVVATLDRRAGGKSSTALEPAATLTLDSEIRDLLGVTDYLRKRFRQDRIYLAAHSGGAIPGTLAVQRHPELFRAYVGAGQVVSPTDNDRTQYEDTLAWARRTGRTELVRRLTKLGPPPYDNLYSYEPMLINEVAAFEYDRTSLAEDETWLLSNLGVPEYSLLDRVHVLRGFLDCYGILYPRERHVDFRVQVPELRVPTYFVAGSHEVPSRTRDLKQWYAALKAPHKELITLDRGGHRSLFEQPAEFVGVMTRVLAETT